MSTFPVVVRKITMQHRTHEKDYHQVLIVNGDGASVVINRWGKRGAVGQRDQNFYSDPKIAVAQLDAKREKKRKDGYVYDAARDKAITTHDEAEFRKTVGDLYFYQLGDHLEKLIPGIDMSGVHKPDKPTFLPDASGEVVYKGYQPKNTYKEPEPTVEDKIAENENWGMW